MSEMNENLANAVGQSDLSNIPASTGMPSETGEILANAREQIQLLVGNMFQITDEDMAGYDACYADVFKNGITFSFMSATFYAQFAAEILVGCLSSNPFRKFLIKAIDLERERTTPGEYWQENMKDLRFGIEGRDYEADISDLLRMMNVSYTKIVGINNWYGTDAGKEEFDMYCLSRKAARDIRTVICQMPYLIRHYDYDVQFAKEIMEYAGIIARQIEQA